MHKKDAPSHPLPKTTMYLNFISSLNSLLYLWNTIHNFCIDILVLIEH